MSLHDALAAASNFASNRFVPLSLDGLIIGWIGPSMAAQLSRWPELFGCQPGSIALAPAAPPELSDALGAVARTLAGEGLIRGWRNERYTIFSPVSGEPLFALERAAMRAFGFTGRAAHLNGFVQGAAGWQMWIARRSHAKPIDPGMLDNLVGGGIAEGMDAPRTLIKECAEEAGIAAELAAQARNAGALRVTREVPEGAHDEILYAYDLELPADFQPVNHDAEVAQFLFVSPAELVELIAAQRLTVDSALVAMDFLARRGCLRFDPGLERRIAALRVPSQRRR